MKPEDQKIIPYLWFDDNAGEAVAFYTSIFQKSKKGLVCRYPKAGQEVHQQEPGSVMTIELELEGVKIIALNGGPHFKLNPSISLFLLETDETELTRIWNALLEGGNVMMPLDTYDWSPKYGWLQDKYGVSWQLMLEEKTTTSEKIIPLIFFTGEQHGKAEAAIKHYTSIFKESKIEGILKYGDENPYAKGAVMHAQFKLENQPFMAMDSGVENNFPFSEAFSFLVVCKDQEEIDYYWDRLTTGGDIQAQQCGWLKDKFGISWQICPDGMESYFADPVKAEKAFEAMLSMKKLDVKVLEKAIQ